MLRNNIKQMLKMMFLLVEFLVFTSGTYKIGNQTIRLNSGSLSIILDNTNMSENGTISCPITKLKGES